MLPIRNAHAQAGACEQRSTECAGPTEWSEAKESEQNVQDPHEG